MKIEITNSRPAFIKQRSSCQCCGRETGFGAIVTAIHREFGGDIQRAEERIRARLATRIPGSVCRPW